MYSVDKAGINKILLSFYKQIEESEGLYKSADITLNKERIQNILYLGMGGSAIAGDLMKDIFFDELTIPMTVVRGYSAPAYCSKSTLVIVSSYSGNTEETLSAAEKVAPSGAQILAVTSGGKLAEMAAKYKWSLITIPQGLPPRQALGYLFFPLYHVLGNLELFKKYSSRLTSLSRFVSDLAKRNVYPQAKGHVLSYRLARIIRNKVPVIYSTAPYLQTVSRRWQNQMQENGKSIAFSNVLPEMNHNEIVGWEQDTKAISEFVVIFLENENPHPRIKKRIELSKKIIKKRGVKVIEVYSSGKTILEKVFSLIVLGDWVSYYLALGYKKDPNEIKNIDYLKKEMAKMK